MLSSRNIDRWAREYLDSVDDLSIARRALRLAREYLAQRREPIDREYFDKTVRRTEFLIRNFGKKR
jgi:hypothetical protein